MSDQGNLFRGFDRATSRDGRGRLASLFRPRRTPPSLRDGLRGRSRRRSALVRASDRWRANASSTIYQSALPVRFGVAVRPQLRVLSDPGHPTVTTGQIGATSAAAGAFLRPLSASMDQRTSNSTTMTRRTSVSSALVSRGTGTPPGTCRRPDAGLVRLDGRKRGPGGDRVRCHFTLERRNVLLLSSGGVTGTYFSGGFSQVQFLISTPSRSTVASPMPLSRKDSGTKSEQSPSVSRTPDGNVLVNFGFSNGTRRQVRLTLSARSPSLPATSKTITVWSSATRCTSPMRRSRSI